MNIAILLGSIRKERQSHKVGLYLRNKLRNRAIETTVIDLAASPLPLLEMQSGHPIDLDVEIKNISRQLLEADAIIFVTPEYHGSFSGVIKNAIDYFWREFQKKPIAIAASSSGKMGGINASTQLQHVISSLGAYALPKKLLISEIHNVFDSSHQPLKESINEDAEFFLDEFLWLTEAIALKKKETQKL